MKGTYEVRGKKYSKAILRWIVERDAEASGTLLGGWLSRLDTLISVIVGVQYGLSTGLLVFVFIYAIKIIVGHFDLKYIHATAYRNHYLSVRAPINVRILKRLSSRR